LPGDDGEPGGGLFGSIVTTDALAAATSDRAWVQAMLDTEVALAKAEERVGVVPPGTALAVREASDTARFDTDELGRAARLGGNPVIPLVAVLRDQLGPGAGDWVHLGATSQDILDTGAMLVADRACSLVEESLSVLCAGCAQLCERHRSTLMAGRTLLQHALPTTFGLKAAGWLTSTVEARAALRSVRARLPVQLGGAVGTLAALGDQGLAVLEAMAEDLGLIVPTIPWHTDRTVVVQLASALGLVAGTGAKIAWDVGLMMQSEVREAFEPRAKGRGGSSTLPQKRNPVGAAAVSSAHRQVSALVSVLFAAMANEHERAVGGWQVEWQTLTSLLRLAGGVAAQVAETIAGLEVDPGTMSANLAHSGDVLMSERVVLALAPAIGRSAATRAVEEAAERSRASGREFGEELAADPVAGPRLAGRLAELFEQAGYLGSADALIDRALARYRSA
jgi:3-carboxy-cis,cis-muconate cycloisomerase